MSQEQSSKTNGSGNHVDHSVTWADDFAAPSPIRSQGGELTYIPACEIDEEDDRYVVSVDMPGMSKDSIQVEVKGDKLLVSGNRSPRKEGSGQFVSERVSGKFIRAIQLDSSVDPEKIEAKYQDGVLNLIVPKLDAAKPRKIEIKDIDEASFTNLLGHRKKDSLN